MTVINPGYHRREFERHQGDLKRSLSSHADYIMKFRNRFSTYKTGFNLDLERMEDVVEENLKIVQENGIPHANTVPVSYRSGDLDVFQINQPYLDDTTREDWRTIADIWISALEKGVILDIKPSNFGLRDGEVLYHDLSDRHSVGAIEGSDAADCIEHYRENRIFRESAVLEDLQSLDNFGEEFSDKLKESLEGSSLSRE